MHNLKIQMWKTQKDKNIWDVENENAQFEENTKVNEHSRIWKVKCIQMHKDEN